MTEPPEPRVSAPGRLALVQALVNSWDMPDGVDQLIDEFEATAWIFRHGFDGVVDAKQRKLLVEVREQLRHLLAAHAGQPVPPGLTDALSRTLRAAAVRPVIDSSGVHLAPSRAGVEGVLADVLAALVEGTVDGSLQRLKVCREDRCRSAFYDNSKNGRGSWCSMRVCGSRAKARAYRARHRHEDSPPEAVPAP